ncbi:MAG: hypothetical protein ACPL1F_07800 [bacterium]
MKIIIGEKQEIEISFFYDIDELRIDYVIFINDINLREKILWNKERNKIEGWLMNDIRKFTYWLEDILIGLIKFLTNDPRKKIKIEFKKNNISFRYYVSLEKNEEELKEYEFFLLEITYRIFEEIILDFAREIPSI